MTLFWLAGDEIRNSMIALIQRNKVITEGAGALACAALISGSEWSYSEQVEYYFWRQYRSFSCITKLHGFS